MSCDVMSGHVRYCCIRAFQEVAWVTKLPCVCGTLLGQHIYSFLGGIYTQYRWTEEEIPLLPDRDNKRININIYIYIKMDKRRDPTVARPKEKKMRRYVT